ncbi:MAG TPA: methionine biosynthesis protein MetW, partial [Opitutales bacterium]|nr:methionine biosynthesis protein MetW [Opitutales bacterium]
MAIAYDSGYYGESETKFVGWSERFIEWCRISRAKRLSRSLKSGARVLDLGCGNGGFLSALAGTGSYDLHGIEIQGGSATRAL